MKKTENNFTVTGFVGKDAEIRQLTTASVARLSLAIGRNEKNGEENSLVSAFSNVEVWRKNENANSFDKLNKGAMLTLEGFFKPEEWSDQEGVKLNRVVLVATIREFEIRETQKRRIGNFFKLPIRLVTSLIFSNLAVANNKYYIMTTERKVTEIFCIADDFCKEFEVEMAKNALRRFKQ